MGLFASIRREYCYISCIGRTMFRLRRIKPDGTRILVDIVEEHAARTPTAAAIYYHDRTVSYRALDEGANRIARWAMGQGIKRGDVVALYLENCPEYLMTWLGLHKLGAVVALINTNLKGAPLAHCISICGSKLVIVGADLGDNYAEAASQMSAVPAVWASGGKIAGAGNLDAALAAVTTDAIDKSVRAGHTAKDNALYIYTSGTTGLPKAANFSHMRMMFMMYGFAGALNTTSRDRTYCALPLYHATGGICAVGMALTAGGAIILRRKFSASEFWDDCRKYRATLFSIYRRVVPLSGECAARRARAAARAARYGRQRAATGNLADIPARFAIPRIVEFYGATEGNVSMLNYDGKVGAVGRVPRYIALVHANPLGAFRYRPGNADPRPRRILHRMRAGRSGRSCRHDHQRGRDIISKAIRATPIRRRRSCVTRSSQRRRLVSHRRSDAPRRARLFLLRRPHRRHLPLEGRKRGDQRSRRSARLVPGIKEVNVYGVSVPGADGRAGMAALVANRDFDPSTLAGKIAGNLASFARPVFMRLRPEMEITGTFKLKKVDLVKDGFDPGRINDPLYWYNQASGCYEALSQRLMPISSPGG